MKSLINPKFIKSILDWHEKPKPFLDEIAVVGRSNVGKSSLINSLVNIKNFARVSKQPGKTQTINFFIINDQFYLVDLPGYGYAKRSKKEIKYWGKSIENYLLNSKELICLFVLIDSKVGVKENDQQLIEWLRFHRIPFEIITTKVDQISRGAIKKREEHTRDSLGLSSSEQVHFFSVKSRVGREELFYRILDLSEKD